MQKIEAPAYIRNLLPYVPGKPIDETKREFGLKKVIKLASNENPLGPSPKAVFTLKTSLDQIHRYPDAGGVQLKKALSKKFAVDPSQIILGNGSDEIIGMIVRTYCQKGDAIVTSKAAFAAYKVQASSHGVRTIECPTTKELGFDCDGILRAAKKLSKAKVIFIANPNNPTGTWIDRAELVSFLKLVQKARGESVLIVLDCAYQEFVDPALVPDPLSFQEHFPNLIVLRTFSKIYGLAGIRLGFGIGHPRYIASLEKIRMPFNVSSLALEAGVASLEDTGFVRKSVELNNKGLKEWKVALEKMGIPFLPSQGNFLLANSKLGLGLPGADLFQACLRQGLILRPVVNYGLHDWIRISVGTKEENAFAIEILSAMRRPRKSS